MKQITVVREHDCISHYLARVRINGKLFWMTIFKEVSE